MAYAREHLPASPPPQRTTIGRLLDLARPLNLGTFRWTGGVTWEPYPCRGLVTEGVDPCDDTDELPTDSLAATCEEWVEQPAFRVLDAMNHSTLNGPEDLYDAFLRTRMDVQMSATFASELITGAASGGHSLSSDATAPTGVAFGSAATPVWNALSVLEAELARRLDGGRGMIHMPPGLLVQAKNYLQFVDGQWQTVTGNVVVADAGYVDPMAPSGADAAASGEDWVYGSGIVSYESSAPDLLALAAQSIDITRNQVRRFVQSLGLLVFDPCPVTAVLVSYDMT